MPKDSDSSALHNIAIQYRRIDLHYSSNFK